MTRVAVAALTVTIIFEVHQQEMRALAKRDKGDVKASNMDFGVGKAWSLGALVFFAYGVVSNRFWLPLGVGIVCAFLDYLIFTVLTKLQSIAVFKGWVTFHNIIYVILIPFEMPAALWAGFLNIWKSSKRT